MKALFCVYVLTVLAPSLHAADDAAIEAQEGDIDHWIEYYKKERATVTPAPVVDEGGMPRTGDDSKPDPLRVDRTGPDTPSSRVPSRSDADR